jgi:hypothetical protein
VRDRLDEAVAIVAGVGQQTGEGGIIQSQDGEHQVAGVAGKSAWQPAEEACEAPEFRPVSAGDPRQA